MYQLGFDKTGEVTWDMKTSPRVCGENLPNRESFEEHLVDFAHNFYCFDESNMILKGDALTATPDSSSPLIVF